MTNINYYEDAFIHAITEGEMDFTEGDWVLQSADYPASMWTIRTSREVLNIYKCEYYCSAADYSRAGEGLTYLRYNHDQYREAILQARLFTKHPAANYLKIALPAFDHELVAFEELRPLVSVEHRPEMQSGHCEIALTALAYQVGEPRTRSALKPVGENGANVNEYEAAGTVQEILSWAEFNDRLFRALSVAYCSPSGLPIVIVTLVPSSICEERLELISVGDRLGFRFQLQAYLKRDQSLRQASVC